MSVQYDTTPPIEYDRLISTMPASIEIVSQPRDEDPSITKSPTGRLYIPGIRHALLRDRCGNTIWVRKEESGVARFEQYGSQGAEQHFRQIIQESFDVVFEDEYGGYYTPDVCRRCKTNDDH